MINTATMSHPPLPQAVWLQVFRGLRYLDLKVVQRFNRSFRQLVAHPSLDAVMYRQGLDPGKIRQATGFDEPDYDPAEAYEYFNFRLHTLLDTEAACRQFPHAAWFGSTSFERHCLRQAARAARGQPGPAPDGDRPGRHAPARPPLVGLGRA